MNSNMKMIQDFDRVLVEDYEPFQIMIIHFNGSFDGDMVANGDVIVSRDKMFLFNIVLDPTNVLFTYDGNFRIKKSFAYIDGKSNYIMTKKESDEFQSVLLTYFDGRSSKYTDYNRNNKTKPFRKTILRKRS